MTERQIASPEIQEVFNFLKSISPFANLPESQLIQAARHVKISYHRAGSQEQILDYEKPTLIIVRSGAFDVRETGGDLSDRVTSGGFFGFSSLLTGDSKHHKLTVFEDGLLYRIDQEVFQNLRHGSLEFDQYFCQAHEKRLRVGLRRRNENSTMAMQIHQVMSSRLVSVREDASIMEAANLMTEHRVASVLVLGEQGELVGIFTDKDIRTRVLIQNVDSDTAVCKVMTPAPISIDKNGYVHQAMVLMIRNNVKHLPVVEGGKAVSIVTLVDLMRTQRTDPVLIINQIHNANDVDGLVEICHKIPELLLHLIKVDMRADDLGRILTTVTGALTRKLIIMAQEKYGTEPVPFVWLAFGSQGRQDQSAKSDQDNGLLLDDSVKSEHDEYFHNMAEFVNYGLDACGYVYCPGDVMAKTDKWRQPLAGWLSVFRQWIDRPTSKALMHASIFFDMRAIYISDGAEQLFDQLQQPILKLAKNSIFLAHLTSNALDLRPPLGFFNRLVLDHNGENKNTLDIKLRGIMPINDIARIKALANGVKAVNTRERLEQLISIKAINKKDGKNLLDAHEYIAHQRLVYQGQQMANGLQPDNHLDPETFSHLTVRQLKDAFQVVRDAQAGIKLTYDVL